MSFFKSKNEALHTASAAMALAAIPVVNFGVALTALMADDAGWMDSFEKGLQSVVFLCALTYVPALLLLPLSLTVYALTSVLSLFENNVGSSHSYAR